MPTRLLEIGGSTHRIRAALRQVLIEGVGADAVGKAVNLHQPVRVLCQKLHQAIQVATRTGAQGGAPGLEEHIAEGQHQAAVGRLRFQCIDFRLEARGIMVAASVARLALSTWLLRAASKMLSRSPDRRRPGHRRPLLRPSVGPVVHSAPPYTPVERCLPHRASGTRRQRPPNRLWPPAHPMRHTLRHSGRLRPPARSCVRFPAPGSAGMEAQPAMASATPIPINN